MCKKENSVVVSSEWRVDTWSMPNSQNIKILVDSADFYDVLSASDYADGMYCQFQLHSPAYNGLEIIVEFNDTVQPSNGDFISIVDQQSGTEVARHVSGSSSGSSPLSNTYHTSDRATVFFFSDGQDSRGRGFRIFVRCVLSFYR